MNTKAIILAAGKSSRLWPLTLETPKPLLDIGGTQPIARLVSMLTKLGIQDIVVAVGYKKEKFFDALGSRVRFREFSDFDTKNNLHTLWSIRDELTEDTLVLYADLVFEYEILQKLLLCKADICLTIDTNELRRESPQVKIEGGRIKKIDKDDSTCNFLGITKFSSRGARELVRAMEMLVADKPNAYYSDAINILIREGIEATPVDIAGSKWIEIDTLKDLEAAGKLIRTHLKNRFRSEMRDF